MAVYPYETRVEIESLIHGIVKPEARVPLTELHDAERIYYVTANPEYNFSLFVSLVPLMREITYAYIRGDGTMPDHEWLKQKYLKATEEVRTASSL